MKLKTIQNAKAKKFNILELEGLWGQLLGKVENSGMWLIYGAEKMGKTTLCLLLANYLADYKKVLYVQAEQGIDLDFQQLLNRLCIANDKKIYFLEYTPIEYLSTLLKRRNQPDIVFIDNVTIYSNELKAQQLQELMRIHSNKLWVFIAHEEDGAPYTAVAKRIKKLAKRIIHVEGNKATIEGRSEGGAIIIDQDKAQLYHGTI